MVSTDKNEVVEFPWPSVNLRYEGSLAYARDDMKESLFVTKACLTLAALRVTCQRGYPKAQALAF